MNIRPRAMITYIYKNKSLQVDTKTASTVVLKICRHFHLIRIHGTYYFFGITYTSVCAVLWIIIRHPAYFHCIH